MQFYVAGICTVDFFRSCDLELDPSCMNLIRIACKYTGYANMNLLCQVFRKLQTDRQNRPKL